MAQWENVETHDYAGCCEGVHTHELVCTADTISTGTIATPIGDTKLNLYDELVALYKKVSESRQMTEKERYSMMTDILRDIKFLAR